MGREIDYLRISVTDRCNLRCRYCMPAEGVRLLAHEEILSYEEILQICRLVTGLGVRKFKVTGGEPLVRKGICDFIAALKRLPRVERVTLTTNGVLLAKFMTKLLEAGIDGINLSLDTLDRKRYAEITRHDLLPAVWEGLEAAKVLDNFKLKINCVIMPSASEDWLQLAALAKDHPLAVRFIEHMPIGEEQTLNFIPEAEVKSILEKTYGPLILEGKILGAGPAVYYRLEGFQGRIGFISALSHKFCHRCNRLRLTSSGFLKTCLQYNTGVDLRPLLTRSPEKIAQAVAEAIANKPAEHFFDRSELPSREEATMSQIGG